MPFTIDVSDELRIVLEKARKRNPELANAAYLKMEQIAQSDAETISHYKNPKYGLSSFSRVHIGSFVLIFKIDQKRGHVLFDRLLHHDDAYRR